jgi:hypothetical protein
MAGIVVFVRVDGALKRSISVFSRAFLNTGKATTTKRWAQRKIIMRGGNARIKQNANRKWS